MTPEQQTKLERARSDILRALKPHALSDVEVLAMFAHMTGAMIPTKGKPQ